MDTIILIINLMGTVAFAASTWELILHCTRSKLPS